MASRWRRGLRWSRSAAAKGYRVRNAYRQQAERFKVKWEGRSYDPGNWNAADPVNRALSAANACLHGLTQAAILTAGYSPAIGFIHTGKALSFVYDIADLYKVELIVPLVFELIACGEHNVEQSGPARIAASCFKRRGFWTGFCPTSRRCCMVVLILERVPPGLRGDLSRWMIEPKAGIFLGRMTARLRDKLWEKAVAGSRGGACFRPGARRASRASSIRTHGDSSRKIIELGGLQLVAIPRS